MTENTLEIDTDKSESLIKIHDKSDRRMGLNRRLFLYSLYIPERRTGKDRRSGKDRRKLPRLQIKN